LLFRVLERSALRARSAKIRILNTLFYMPFKIWFLKVSFAVRALNNRVNSTTLKIGE